MSDSNRRADLKAQLTQLRHRSVIASNGLVADADRVVVRNPSQERLEADESWDNRELGASPDHVRRAGEDPATQVVVRVDANLDPDLYMRIQAYAESLNLTPAAALRFLIRSYLPKVK